MHMPGCTGLELAAIIRQQPAYVSIPIVFLSTEANRDRQLAAMHLGGDDFLTKPIKPDHLISAVTSRVQRARTLRSFMIRDSLTGLLNHTNTREHLDIEVARAQRQHGLLTLALLDIDHFKAVNDTYGHPTGDRVIKSLARLLQQRLRKTDIIGRYGGEEFAVILPHTDGLTAVKLLDEIRATFAHVRHQVDDCAFSVTFSCGIACFPDYADATQLTHAADQTLYDAKRSGRNQVLLANFAHAY
jgi:diguanylate cyclase (GGDEF)-like protein